MPQIIKFICFILITILLFNKDSFSQKTFSTVISPNVDLTGANGSCSTPGTTSPHVFSVPVSNVGTASATNQLLLASIELNDCGTYEGGSFSKNFNLVNIRLMSPSGICYGIYNGGLSTTGTGTHFLNLVSTTTCLTNPNTANAPIGGAGIMSSGNNGYFNAQFSGSPTYYSNYTGNLNGDWKIIFSESTSSEPCIASIRLVFGDPTITPQTTNGQTCATALVWNGKSPICTATLSSISGSAEMPGSLLGNNTNSFGTIGGQTCEWNNANNNDIWIKYTATTAFTCLTISGINGANNDLQSIVVTDKNADGDGIPCTQVSITETDDPNWIVASCPRNSIYISTIGNEKNQQHCFSSVPGKDYYLVVDGNGGAASTFWVWGSTAPTLPALLPADQFKLKGLSLGNTNQLKWELQYSKNVSAYHIQRGTERLVFNDICVINVSSSNSISDYSDWNAAGGNYFYRILVQFTDGTFAISNIIFLKTASINKISVFPNPGKGIFTLSGLEKNASHHIRVVDVTGKLILSANTNTDTHRINMTDAAPGVYFIQVDGKEHLRFVNLK